MNDQPRPQRLFPSFPLSRPLHPIPGPAPDRAARRAFLKAAGVATSGIALAACRPIPPIDDAEPAMGQVTAAQVTDPESLKAFVLAAKDKIQGDCI